MGDSGYMDAAAVPVLDAEEDTLRERLIEVLTRHTPHAVYATGAIKIVADPVADALLPLIRDHVAAAVQAERERPPTQYAYDQACEALHKHRERADKAEAAIERALAVHREHTNTGLVARCKCLACDMARALDETEASDG